MKEPRGTRMGRNNHWQTLVIWLAEHVLEPSPKRRRGAPESGRPGRAPGEQGFILLIALVAMVALTALGVATVTSASIDLKVAHNLRRMEMAKYASMAGMEHGRLNLMLDKLPSSGQVRNFDEPDAATSDYISTSEATLMRAGDGSYLGIYKVKSVAVKCSGPPAGYSTDLFYSEFFDLHSTGMLLDSSGKELSPASSETVLTVRKVAEGRCFKR